jgi:SAM-dependent methyltransferase
MSELRQQTIDTYNNSAKELAEYFQGIGPRINDVDLAFELANNPLDARVLEIGCGDGRDAEYILQKAGQYIGFDISEELINLAKARNPNGEFVVADAVDYEYPNNLNVVVAFASLLHLDKEEVREVMAKVQEALVPGGTFYISVKHKQKYTEELVEDKFGMRLFYFYDDDTMINLAGEGYEVASKLHKVVGKTKWLELVLRKEKSDGEII